MPSRNSLSWIMFHEPIWTLFPFLSHSANVYWASAMGQAPASAGSTLTNVTVSLPLRSSVSNWEDTKLIIKIQDINCYIRAEVFSLGSAHIWGWIILICGGCLCTVECWAAYLASTHSMPEESSLQWWQPKMSLDIAKNPLGNITVPVENHCQIKTFTQFLGKGATDSSRRSRAGF